MAVDIITLGNIAKSLVYDRTQADVEYALANERGGVYADDDLRGAYNASDKNRIGGAVNYIAECLFYIGTHEAVLNVIKDDWGPRDIVGADDNRMLLSALANLKQLLPYNVTPSVPRSMDGLTYRTANTIERIICDIYGVFARLWGSWLFCGDGYASGFDADDRQIFDDNWFFDQTLT